MSGIYMEACGFTTNENGEVIETATKNGRGVKVNDVPERDNEWVKKILKIDNIEDYKKAFAEIYPENAIPEGNVRCESFADIGTKIFVGNQAYVPETNVVLPSDIVERINREVTTIDEAKKIVEEYIGSIDRNPDSHSLEDERTEQRGNPENNEMTRAQRASLER